MRIPPILIVVAIIAAAIAYENRHQIADHVAPAQPVGEFQHPGTNLQVQVNGITLKLRGNPDAERIAYLFLHSQSIADSARSFGDIVTRNQSLTAGLARVGGTNAPSIKDDVDRVFRDHVGTNGTFDESARGRCKEAYRAIAWAAKQAVGGGGYFQTPSIPRIEWSAVPETRGPPVVMSSRPMQRVDSADDYDWRKFTGGLRTDIEAEPGKLTRLIDLPRFSRTEKKNDSPRWLTHSLRIDPVETAKLQKLTRFGKFFSDDLIGDSIGKTRLLYRAARHFDASLFSDERQVVGDCVSHATRNACDISRAIEILVHGEPEAWVNRGATELIYGLRRHRGEGMVVTNVPDIITNRGGIIARGKYGSVDLSQYNGHIGQRWGDRDGPPRDLIVESQRYQIREAALVKTTSEARDAIWSGYGLITGAQASFSEHRDSHGFGKLNGRNWAHSQSIAAVSTAYTLAGDNWRDYGRHKSSPCYLMINSWGAWNDCLLYTSPSPRD